MRSLIPFVVWLFIAGNSFASENITLRDISIREGLSNMDVTDIIQDGQGYMWIATMRGLNRFNGYDFSYYGFVPEDSTSLRSSQILSLHETKDGMLLVGSTKGLDCYDQRREQFFRVLDNSKDEVRDICEINREIFISTNSGVGRLNIESRSVEMIGANRMSSLTPGHLRADAENNLWCTFVQSPTFARFDAKSNKFDYFTVPKSSANFSFDYVTTLNPVSSKLIMIGMNTGVVYFNPQTGLFLSAPQYDLMSRSLRGKHVLFILEKESDVYWVGTLKDGLFVFDKRKNSIKQSKEGSFITYCVDRDGNVWFGTENAGMKVYFEQGKKINFDVGLNEITQDKFVSHIAKNRDGDLLISTRECGYYVYNLASGAYVNVNEHNSQLLNSRIRTMYADSLNNYWLGLYSGIQLQIANSNTFQTLSIPKPNIGASVFLQVNNLMLAGCEGHGIMVYDLKGNLMKQITDYGSSIVGMTRLNDHEVLLLSQMNGVYVMNINSLTANCLDIDDKMFSRSKRDIITMYVDRRGTLWVGAYNYGLFEIDMNRRTVTNYNTSSMLLSNDVVGISEDARGNIWISTSLGLARMDIKNKSINVFDVGNDIGNYQFHRNAVYKDGSGVIYFGGNVGLTYLQPDIFDSTHVALPRVNLEKLFVMNHQIKASYQNSLLSQALLFTDRIELNHSDKMINIEFASPEYLAPYSLQYFYMLEGFDKEWINAGSQRKAVYSNLSAGDYLFKVKVRNNEGIWSEEVTLKIHVNPPMWWTWWAWCLYILSLGLLTYVIFRLILTNALYRKELDIEVYEHGMAEESHLMKRRFFTNIAHELRTPLTMILGMVKQLSSFEGSEDQRRDIVSYLDVSVQRLLRLINQLLDFRNLENDTLALWLKEGDINEDIATIVQPYSIFTGEKNIQISLLDGEHYTMFYDLDKIEKILSNLLLNAIKHTDEGKIEVSLAKVSMSHVKHNYDIAERLCSGKIENFIEISVSDTGEGVDHKQLETIFERYNKGGKSSSQANFASTGIGLHFSRSLVELHCGAIKVSDTMGGGATFSFILPYEHEIYDPKSFATDEQRYESVINTSVSSAKDIVNVTPDMDKTIMIVEDDPQINRFIKENMQKYYNVISVFDGAAALQLLKTKQPDVIITDVMMPKMDGLKMIKHIRENSSLNHIVIIVLSAKSEVEDQISGLDIGANLYLSKPIQINHLLAIVDSQLKNRQRISEMFLQGLMPNLNRSSIGKQDMEFLGRLNLILEAELSNIELGIALISEKMNMSKSSFYRKFISVTDIMPNAYIKKYRINRAIEYMNEGTYSLNDIVDMVGFGSTSYFSTVFKHEKQISPSDYIKKLKTNS